MEICYVGGGVLTDAVEQRRRTAMLWFIQVDAAAGVVAVDEGRRRQSLGAQGRCEEEYKDEEGRVKNEKGPCPYL